MSLQIVDQNTQQLRSLTTAEQTTFRSGVGAAAASDLTTVSATATAAQSAATAAQSAAATAQSTADSKAPLNHVHAIANVTGLQAALDGKATSAQGSKADTALQPGVIPSGTTIPLSQVTGAGTAASQPSTAFATATQGSKADSAIQQSGMPSAMVAGYASMTSDQKLAMHGISRSATQPAAASYSWWSDPTTGTTYHSDGSSWTVVS